MSPTLCAALYRSVTEKHDFYSCETVRSDVTTQFIRDFKVSYIGSYLVLISHLIIIECILQGTFLSIFNEDTELGKKYVFDIQRTCREVHDHARRYLHNNGILPAGHAAATTNDQSDVTTSVDQSTAQMIQAEVARQMAEHLSCKICMDESIDAVFEACRHAISCMKCAQQ